LRSLDVVRTPRVHVEPTPCEREPESGLGAFRPTARKAPTWFRPGSHGRGPIGEVGAL
jgi:hypothetical protein